MPEFAQLVVEVSPKGIQEARRQLDELSGAGKKTETSFGDLAKQIAGYSTAANLAVQAGQAVLRGIKDLAVESITLAAGFEKSRMTWGVLVGDMDAGNDVFEKLITFAAETPLAFDAVEKAAQTLKGFGISTSELIPTLSRLGDVALGDNAKLGQLALVFGQVNAQGRAMTQDLYQFVNAGVPIFQLLADTMGVTAGEVKGLASEGKIGFEEISAAIKAATDEGGTYYDLMSKTAETTAGKWSTAIDGFNQNLAALGSVFLPEVNKVLDQFIKTMDKLVKDRSYVDFLTTGVSADPSKMLAIVQEERGRLMKSLVDAEKLPAQYRAQSIAAINDALKMADQRILTLQYQQLAAGQRAGSASMAARGSEGPAPAAPSAAAAPADLPLSDINDFIYGPLLDLSRPAAIGLTDLGLAAADTGTKIAEFAEDTSAADAVLAKYGDQTAAIEKEMDLVSQLFATGSIDSATYTRAMEALGEQLENMDPAAVKARQAIAGLKAELAQIATQVTVDAFLAIGEAMYAGADANESMEESLARMGLQILNQLPMMFLSAGLQLITMGQWQVGLGLIAMAGVTGIAAGYANSASAEATNNALGGVYSSRSLSSYSGGVYDKPQLFNFASGGAIGRFGEAGPEAIMPLQRGADGRLGVTGSGSTVVVQIIDQTTAGVSKSTEETTSPDGQKQLRVFLRDAVKNVIASGEADGAMSRFGLRPAAARVY